MSKKNKIRQRSHVLDVSFRPKNSTTTPPVTSNEKMQTRSLWCHSSTVKLVSLFREFVCVLPTGLSCARSTRLIRLWEVARRRSLNPSPSRSRSQRKYIVYFQCHLISLNTTVHYTTVTILFFSKTKQIVGHAWNPQLVMAAMTNTVSNNHVIYSNPQCWDDLPLQKTRNWITVDGLCGRTEV